MEINQSRSESIPEMAEKIRKERNNLMRNEYFLLQRRKKSTVSVRLIRKISKSAAMSEIHHERSTWVT
jgi:hypothetical protein